MNLDELALKEGFWYRPGSSDLTSISDTLRMSKRDGFVKSGDRVLDMGAHIGTFTRRALDAGAVQVLAVEPAPDNIELFWKNINDGRVELYEGAVSESLIGEETFYLNTKKGTDSHSLIVKRGRTPIQVRTYTFDELCDGLDPNFVKIDIEGGEYDIDLIGSMPASADRLFIEFHFKHKGHREQAEALRLELLVDQGFTPVWESHWTENAWWAEGMFRR